MRRGDAIFTVNARDERQNGWLTYKAPKGERFVFLLLGTVPKDATDFDVDGALNELGWYFRDSDRNPEGEDAQRLSAEHESAGPTGIAEPSDPSARLQESEVRS